MILKLIIKYCFIFLCGAYTYTKLINSDIRPYHLFPLFLFSIIFSAASYWLRIWAPTLRVILLTTLFCICLLIIFWKPLKASVIAGTVSLAVSFFMFAISTVLLIPFGLLLGPHLGNKSFFGPISFAIAGFIQLLITSVFFRIKRLKNGIPHLLAQQVGDSGIYVCIAILLIFSVFPVVSNEVLFALLIFVIWGGFYLISWWKKKLHQLYLQKTKQNEIQALLHALECKEAEIINLKQQNEELSKIIHKDNKLIPAMQLAVHALLTSSIAGDPVERDKIAALSAQLSELENARINCLNQYENANITVPKTDILSTDGVISYCANRAIEWGIHFDFSLSGSLRYMVNHILLEGELNTLIADLVENALIATKNSDKRAVLLNIGIDSSKTYRVDVFDTGCLFQSDTLRQLGKVRTTTHQDTGGSGIGLMNTFELLKKHHASFLINEILPGTCYTKCVSILFDNAHKFEIISNREELSDYLTSSVHT